MGAYDAALDLLQLGGLQKKGYASCLASHHSNSRVSHLKPAFIITCAKCLW